jgi:hypothetical protein
MQGIKDSAAQAIILLSKKNNKTRTIGPGHARHQGQRDASVQKIKINKHEQ